MSNKSRAMEGIQRTKERTKARIDQIRKQRDSEILVLHAARLLPDKPPEGCEIEICDWGTVSVKIGELSHLHKARAYLRKMLPIGSVKKWKDEMDAPQVYGSEEAMIKWRHPDLSKVWIEMVIARSEMPGHWFKDGSCGFKKSRQESFEHEGWVCDLQQG